MYCSGRTCDPVFGKPLRFLGFIDFAAKFQVGELKKQWISTVLRARKRKKVRATAPFSKTAWIPTSNEHFWNNSAHARKNSVHAWKNSAHTSGSPTRKVTFQKVHFSMLRIDHLYNVLSILSEMHDFPLFRDRKSTTCITFLNDFQKEHVFKNIVFLRKCSNLLDRWSISEPKMTTCITFLKGSDV